MKQRKFLKSIFRLASGPGFIWTAQHLMFSDLCFVLRSLARAWIRSGRIAKRYRDARDLEFRLFFNSGSEMAVSPVAALVRSDFSKLPSSWRKTVLREVYEEGEAFIDSRRESHKLSADPSIYSSSSLLVPHRGFRPLSPFLSCILSTALAIFRR